MGVIQSIECCMVREASSKIHFSVSYLHCQKTLGLRVDVAQFFA